MRSPCPAVAIHLHCHTYQYFGLFKISVSGTYLRPPPPLSSSCPLIPWVYSSFWRRKWKPTPVFLPGESHGQRNLVGYSVWGCRVRHDWAANTHSSFGPPWRLLWFSQACSLLTPAPPCPAPAPQPRIHQFTHHLKDPQLPWPCLGHIHQVQPSPCWEPLLPQL